MAAQVLFDGAGNITFDCNGNIVFCDATASTYLCCTSCVSGVDGDTSYYNLLVPCGPINLNVSGVGTNGCDNCAPLNDDFEVDGGGPTSCVSWSENFGTIVDQPAGACSLIQLLVDLIIEVCCDDTNDEIVLYADFAWVFGDTSIDTTIELDRQDIVDGECYFFDLHALLAGAGLTFTCTNDDDINCSAPQNGCSDGSNCTVSGGTWKFTTI